MLAERILHEARAIGYAKLRLDTVEPVMKNAVALARLVIFMGEALAQQSP